VGSDSASSSPCRDAGGHRSATMLLCRPGRRDRQCAEWMRRRSHAALHKQHGVRPYHDDDRRLREFGGYFASINRNKKSMAIDLKKHEGRDLVLGLVRRADAIVENSGPASMERLGLGDDALERAVPKLVYATIPRFWETGARQTPMPIGQAYERGCAGTSALVDGDHRAGQGRSPVKVGRARRNLVPDPPMCAVASSRQSCAPHKDRPYSGQLVRRSRTLWSMRGHGSMF